MKVESGGRQGILNFSLILFLFGLLVGDRGIRREEDDRSLYPDVRFVTIASSEAHRNALLKVLNESPSPVTPVLKI